MHTSTMLATVLSAMALASPVTKPNAEPDQNPVLQKPIFINPIIGPTFVDPVNGHPIFVDPVIDDTVPTHVKRSNNLLNEVDSLLTCIRNDDELKPDFSEAPDGIFYASDVHPACCQQAKALYKSFPDGQFGHAGFNEPCDEVIVTGLTNTQMNVLRGIFSGEW
ncbi:hypothetical protein KVR01_012073 [Diaporthe batatas]|uniref:uncharacterized protein n=1 Tax=Diaporthe batatas TaxID=748121 RepID=UPI001D059B3D|nr:uncharacterized protein KVR01_012073 [Diaporthe batatas]KAG8158312.1 hypothetical protein KVR01_012073 [Diaporthe batatas]